jgi:hypothetical protein
LNMQPAVIARYRLYLKNALNIGIFKGFKIGLGNGGLFSVCFMSYALGFWYGSVLVAHDIRNNCVDNCNTGGSILATFFCVLMGGIALGQVCQYFIISSNESIIICICKYSLHHQQLLLSLLYHLLLRCSNYVIVFLPLMDCP